jgi:hypothetical protein
MDVSEGSKNNGALLHVWDCTGVAKKIGRIRHYKTIEKSKQWNMYGLGGGDQNNGVRLHMWTCDEQNENQNGRW